MEVIDGVDNIKRAFRNPVITIGNFDGVHIGHLSLFQRVKELAEELEGESLIISFKPHPIKVIYPGNGPPLITPHEQKVQLLEEAGIDVLIVVEFTREFAKLILIANILAWPLAYYAMNRWLGNFAYADNIHISPFLVSIGLAILIAWITVSYQTLKAAATMPFSRRRKYSTF